MTLDAEKMMERQEVFAKYADPIGEDVHLEYTLSEKQELARYGWFRDSVGHGWFGLIAPIIHAIRKHNMVEGNTHIELHQIKEKIGGLRFYVGTCTDEIRDMIRKAEEKSLRVCEVCGMDGQRRYLSWIRTLCDDCVTPLLALEPKYEDKDDAGSQM